MVVLVSCNCNHYERPSRIRLGYDDNNFPTQKLYSIMATTRDHVRVVGSIRPPHFLIYCSSIVTPLGHPYTDGSLHIYVVIQQSGRSQAQGVVISIALTDSGILVAGSESGVPLQAEK